VRNADLRVDGNALAGVLGEVFVHEMTSARIKCQECGEVEPLGAEHVYMKAPGSVVRCCHCEDVLLVITHRDGGYLLGFQKMMWLELG
jgi:ribosomal protein S27E